MERISDTDQKRIAQDAHIAISALKSIEVVGREADMHPTYFYEKYRTAKKCMDFIDAMAKKYGYEVE